MLTTNCVMSSLKLVVIQVSACPECRESYHEKMRRHRYAEKAADRLLGLQQERAKVLESLWRLIMDQFGWLPISTVLTVSNFGQQSKDLAGMAWPHKSESQPFFASCYVLYDLILWTAINWVKNNLNQTSTWYLTQQVVDIPSSALYWKTFISISLIARRLYSFLFQICNPIYNYVKPTFL